MSTGDELSDRLRELHDAYAWAVNAAVAQGRDDLVAELADDYTTESLRLITGAAPDSTPPPQPATVPRQRGWLRRLRSSRQRR